MALITTLQRFRYQAFNRIGERDKELAQLRDGQLTSKRKPKSTPETRTEAFNKYLKFFYDRPRIQVNVTLNICGYLFKIKLSSRLHDINMLYRRQNLFRCHITIYTPKILWSSWLRVPLHHVRILVTISVVCSGRVV